jgi:hypothetical protein
MFLPAEYLWLEPVLIVTIVVFLVAWLGNIITSYSLINAFLTALFFGAVFGALTYFGYGKLDVAFNSTPAPDAPANIQRQTN